jgi:teichuronic acid biosynthesis glycosyltransferase TuaC
MRVLIVTKIFPSAVDPTAAPYNRQQFAALARRCEVEVLALVPWLPGLGWTSRAARQRAQVPRRERIDGLDVRHPRVLYAPRLGRALSGPLYAASLAPYVLPHRGRYDVVLGSFAYPDGWAAVALGKMLGVPTVIKLHGSDINVFGADRLLRPSLRWALSHAAAVVAPSRALIEAAIALGADPARARAIGNGIDETLFRPRDRAAARAELGQPNDKKRLLFIGRLDRKKGAIDLLEAMRRLPAATRRRVELVMIGDGVESESCHELARDLPVTFAGILPATEVARHIAASDLVVLPSWAEGTPNAIVEALASGRRVVASDVGGIPAVVSDPRLGELVPARQPASLAGAIARAVATDYDPAEIAALAPFPSWDDSAAALYDVLTAAVAR